MKKNSKDNSKMKKTKTSNYLKILINLTLFFILSYFILAYLITGSHYIYIGVLIFFTACLFIVIYFFNDIYLKIINKINPVFRLFLAYLVLVIITSFSNKFLNVNWIFLGFLFTLIIIYDSKINPGFIFISALLLIGYIPFLLIAKEYMIVKNISLYIFYFILIGIIIQIITEKNKGKYELDFKDFIFNDHKKDIKAFLLLTIFLTLIIMIIDSFYSIELIKTSFIYLMIIFFSLYIIKSIEKKS
ncbi:MAG: hypothetical protein Q8N99_03120 [Nanoarchaeota archaeon]|nr:hypothetical protein [Nanoarchaeota archaeon]